MKTISVLFVCDTNITLSPLASACFLLHTQKAGLEPSFRIESAGCFAGKTQRSIDRRMKKIADEQELFVPVTTSRNVDRELIEGKDLVIVMNDENFWHIKRITPEITSDHLRLLMEFSGQLGIREMPDPLQGDISYQEAYELVFKVTGKMLEAICREFELKPAHTAP